MVGSVSLSPLDALARHGTVAHFFLFFSFCGDSCFLLWQCQHIRQDLTDCVLKTDCYLKQGNSAQECITSRMTELPLECQQLYKSFVECRRGMVSTLPPSLLLTLRKRTECNTDDQIMLCDVGIGQLDMRKRFRGNAPPAAGNNNAPGGTSQVDPSTAGQAGSS